MSHQLFSVSIRTRLWAILLLSCSWLVAPGLAMGQSQFKPRGEHPYLFFTPANIAALKNHIATDKGLAGAWDRIKAQADDTGSGSALAAGGDVEWWSDGRLETWCLAYRMTGDKRYAMRVRDLLMQMIHRPSWADDEVHGRTPPWHSGLRTGSSCYAVAVGYDAIYDALTDSERKTISSGLINLGILPIVEDWVMDNQRIHSLDSMGHNWWSVCVFNAGIAAMAVINEDPRAAEWLDRINEGSVEWANYGGSELDTKPRTIDPAGTLYESVNYANYGMYNYLRFRLAWTNALTVPPPNLPVLDHTADFFMNVSYPNTSRFMSLNFGDSRLNADGRSCVEVMWALGDHKPRNLWYLNQTDDNRGQGTRDELQRTTALGLLYDPGTDSLAAAPKTPDLPPSAMFKAMGWAMLRSSWDKNATLLGVKSGFTFNHAHADAGAFLLFHGGKYLLITSGVDHYSSPTYSAYYRQSPASNVVLFNGEAENPEDVSQGSQFPGTVSNLIDAGDLKYVWADATGPTSKHFIRNFRHFLWIGDVILIFDDLKTYQTGQFEWLLHYDGQPQRNGFGVRIAQDDAAVTVEPLFPEMLPAGNPDDSPGAMRLVEKMGLKDHDENTKVPYYAFTPTQQARQTDFITGLILSRPAADNSGSPPPQLSRLQGKNMIGVRVRQNGTTTDVYLNTLAATVRSRPSFITINGWETDAYLTAMTYPDGADPGDPDKITRYFVADGSYLRKDGKRVLNSLSKVFATWKCDESGTMDVTLQGQAMIQARIRAEGKPTNVTLNGQSAPAAYDPYLSDMVTLSVRPSESK